jgi:hypothetical protein
MLYSLFFGINKIIAGKITVNDFYRHQANFISMSWVYPNQSLKNSECLLEFSLIL